MAIEKCKTEKELIETLEKVISVTKEKNQKEKLGRIIQYILRPIIGEERGEKRGERRGRLEGNREGIIYVAKEMLKEKISTEKIVKVTKLKEEIEKIKEELASA